MITSKNNALIENVSKLKMKKYRDETGLFALEGERFVLDALKRRKARTLLATPDKVQELGEEYSIEARIVSEEVFKSLSELKTPQGLLGVFEKDEISAQELMGYSKILYLDGVQNPDNAGALARSAVCAGFDAMVADPDTADLYAPKALRASAGATLCIKTCRGGVGVLGVLKDAGYRIAGGDLDGSEDFGQMSGPFVIAVGNEGEGLGEEVKALCDELLRLPIVGECESLNVSVAGGMLMYKAAGLI